jgi:4-diphosphocytidyl-2-C-methyl-D-erythritol kinase
VTTSPAATTARYLRAHAKINLDLRVLAVRPDGYHELVTVLQTVALHDTLRFTPSPGPFRLAGDAPGVPADRTNLVWRAAERLWAAAGRPGAPEGVTVTLEKRIPVQAGLGGGSADAAAALLGLHTTWGLRLSEPALRELAGELGADVPYFFTGGTCVGRGRGDRLETLPDLAPHQVLIALPAFGVATPDAYRWYDEDGWPPSAAPLYPLDASAWAAWLDRCRNDLQASVTARHAEIDALVHELRAAGACLAAMSGSGSAVFGLFDDWSLVEQAAGRLAARGVRCLRTATLGRPEYERSLAGDLGLPGRAMVV